MKADVAAGLVIFAAATCLYLFGGLPPVTGAGSNRNASFWPLLILGLMAVLGLALAIQALRKSTRGEERPTRPLATSTSFGAIARNVTLILMYPPALFLFGFYVSAFAFALIVPPIVGQVKWRASALFAIVFTSILWFLFTATLRIELPAGQFAFAWPAAALKSN